MKTIRKVFNSIIKDINVNDKTLTAFVSTNAVDRMGDVLEPKGADLKAFNKNPVVMFAHDYGSPPIAKALWTKKSKKDGKDGILSKMEFASTEFGQEIFDLYKDGFMNAFSVGFIPKESEPMEEGGSQWGPQRFLKWEMLEYSAVPVPANAEALALAVSKGIISEDRKKALEDMKRLQEDKDKKDEEEEMRFYDEDGNEVQVPKKEFDYDDFIKFIEDHKDDDNVSSLFMKEEKSAGLDDLIAENELLEEKIKALDKEIPDLKYKLYLLMNKEELKKAPEITVDTLADKFVEIIDGVVREAKGKVS